MAGSTRLALALVKYKPIGRCGTADPPLLLEMEGNRGLDGAGMGVGRQRHSCHSLPGSQNMYYSSKGPEFGSQHPCWAELTIACNSL